MARVAEGQAGGASALVVSASAPAAVMAEEQDNFFISQTQNIASQFPVAEAPDQGVVASLISLTETGVRYDVKNEQREVRLGRHPDCEVKVADKRVSGFHLRIRREDHGWFVEEHGNNGAYINNQLMKKGEFKSLQHGDAISIGVPAENTAEAFCAYIFRISENDISRNPSKDGAITVVEGRREGNAPADPNVILAHPSASHFVSEQWVKNHWDTRTVLGSGNFSEVRLGVNVHGGEKRAVKIIDKKKFLQFQSKRETHLKLSSEADVLLKLKHPGVLGFYEWFETDNHLYLVTELLQGGDLLQDIMENGCFTETVAKRLFRQLCDAVRYLHDNAIVHRDLKPENILLTTKDRDSMMLKIADFGLARTNMKSRDCRTFCGTPHYFAPEVINTFRDRETPAAGYGKQADMWSMGVILYIMLSGIPPFEEDGLYEQILEGKYEFDVREWTTVSPEAKELVRSLMTVNPKDRLSIQEAYEHRWFRFCGLSSCPSPTRNRPNPPAFFGDVKPIAENEPCAKRRRTEDVPMGDATTTMQEHSPLGA